MAYKNNVKAIPVTSLSSASLVAGFSPINSALPIPEPLIIMRIINAATTPITISYDGIGIHDYIPANGVLDLNFITSSLPSNASAHIAKNTTVYAAGTAGVGTIYLVGYFQPQQ